MNVHNQIELPVSFGEAFDKLSILDIKLQKIKDTRRLEVQKEYDLLSNKLTTFMNGNVKYYYDLITDVNLNIWNIQDEIRYKSFTDAEKGNICLEILDENDRRFRIKNKIDTVLNSNIKEQKGYVKKSCFLLTNLENSFMLNGIVRYFSTSYDKVILTCNTTEVKELERLYCNDANINLLDFSSVDQMHTYMDNNSIVNKYTVIDLRENNTKYELYNKKYFNIPDTDVSDKLHKILEDNDVKEYIFIHGFENIDDITIKFIEENISKTKDEILFINSSYNIYDKDHKFYSIADNFMCKLITEYKDVIVHAKKIFVNDNDFLATVLRLIYNGNYQVIH